MRIAKFALKAGVIALLGLSAAVAINTWRQGSRQVQVSPAPVLALDEAALADKLAGAIRIATISQMPVASAANGEQAPQADTAVFERFHAYLAQRFPRVHASLKLEKVATGNLSLLYTWPGTDASAKPILLMAHQDVVPIAPGTEKDWQVEPFAGTIKDGFIWGRGAWDNKANLIGQLQALEMLIESGFKPRQTVYVAMGHDEEIGGMHGAVNIVKLFQSRGIRFGFVLDEGLLVTQGIMPGLARPVALIGIAEKGYLSVVMRVPATPGHSSMPPAPGTTAIAMMSAAMKRLDDEQMPASLRGVAREMFETIAPEMSGFQRVALSNLWLFGPLVERQLEQGASTQAMLRTTTALTVFQAGNKDNVIPGRAEGVVNFRLLPGDSIAGVMDHVKSKLPDAGQGRFELIALDGSAEPSPVSPTKSESYELMQRTVRQVFPEAAVSPGLMVAGTDSRHFTPVSDHIYRFSPVRAKPEDLSRFHGTNERIAVSNLAEVVRFYYQLIKNASIPSHN